MRVIPITKSQAKIFIVEKHYSRRMPIFWAGFGLEENGRIEGVVVYGQPSAPIQKHAFKDRSFRLYELSRLVVQTKTKNAASFLVGNSLKMLPKPCAVVSYADSEQGHCGYVYQATNWKYTGATKSHDHLYIINGKRTHPMTLRDMGVVDNKRWAKENNIQTVAPMPKHRYFYVCADRRTERRIWKTLSYPIVETYPKCVPNRYDDGEKIFMPVGIKISSGMEVLL